MILFVHIFSLLLNVKYVFVVFLDFFQEKKLDYNYLITSKWKVLELVILDKRFSFLNLNSYLSLLLYLTNPFLSDEINIRIHWRCDI